VCGLRVTDDIGYRFTDIETEYGLFCGMQMRQRGFECQSYTCCLQRVAGEVHLGGQALRAVAADRLAHLAQSRSCSFFDVRNLLGCTLRIAIDKASGEF
jgi:hypothetical protein